jgi:ankyrin repeat protein
MRLLLEAGADVHLHDDDCRSPLRWALHKQDPESVRLLLEHGADPFFKSCFAAGGSKFEETVTDLFIASQGAPAIAKMVEDASHKFKLCNHLREASSKEPNDLAAMAKLLDEGCPVDIKDAEDRTALMYVCVDQDSAAVKLLLDHGANPEIAMRDGDTTAMYFACAVPRRRLKLGPDPAIVQMLIDHGGNPRRVCRNGQTLMHAAAATGSEEIMQLIAKHGVSPTATTNDGQSPVERAIEYGNAAAVPVVEGVVEWHKGYIEDLAQEATQLRTSVQPLKRLSFAPRT